MCIKTKKNFRKNDWNKRVFNAAPRSKNLYENFKSESGPLNHEKKIYSLYGPCTNIFIKISIFFYGKTYLKFLICKYLCIYMCIWKYILLIFCIKISNKINFIKSISLIKICRKIISIWLIDVILLILFIVVSWILP